MMTYSRMTIVRFVVMALVVIMTTSVATPAHAEWPWEWAARQVKQKAKEAEQAVVEKGLEVAQEKVDEETQGSWTATENVTEFFTSGEWVKFWQYDGKTWVFSFLLAFLIFTLLFRSLKEKPWEGWTAAKGIGALVLWAGLTIAFQVATFYPIAYSYLEWLGWWPLIPIALAIGVILRFGTYRDAVKAWRSGTFWSYFNKNLTHDARSTAEVLAELGIGQPAPANAAPVAAPAAPAQPAVQGVPAPVQAAAPATAPATPAPQEPRCPGCQKPLGPNPPRFCYGCGTPLAPAAPVAQVPSAPATPTRSVASDGIPDDWF